LWFTKTKFSLEILLDKKIKGNMTISLYPFGNAYLKKEYKYYSKVAKFFLSGYLTNVKK
jgi:hypothetical protein